jgi:exopolyphosphatase
LARAGINPDHLLFTDDVELGEKVAQGAELVLVDHNSLEAPLPPARQRVTAIIDHHHDHGAFPDASPRIIDQVGSTATLVAELVLREKGEMAASAALLLLSALLMDTVNLSAQAGRSTARDQAMAEKLLALSGVERDSFFNSLQQAQHDLKGLSTQQLLGRDYKEWPDPVGRYGMSTVLLSLDQWRQQETDLTAALARFARQKGLAILMVMLVSYEPDFQRELIILCRDKKLLINLVTFLEQQGLRLSVHQGSTAIVDRDGYLGFYRQGTVSISRKKLQPLVHRFLASLHGKQQE